MILWDKNNSYLRLKKLHMQQFVTYYLSLLMHHAVKQTNNQGALLQSEHRFDETI